MSRNEANAASSAATSLSTSKNRGERLAAIEKQIAVLKTQADEKAASAQTAAETAQSNVTLWISCARKAKQGVTNCLP